jgi:hypothetical protein
MGNSSSSSQSPSSTGDPQILQVGNLKISQADIAYYMRHSRPYPHFDAFVEKEWDIPRDEILRKPFNEVKQMAMSRLQMMDVLIGAHANEAVSVNNATDKTKERTDGAESANGAPDATGTAIDHIPEFRRVDFTKSAGSSLRKSPKKSPRKSNVSHLESKYDKQAEHASISSERASSISSETPVTVPNGDPLDRSRKHSLDRPIGDQMGDQFGKQQYDPLDSHVRESHNSHSHDASPSSPIARRRRQIALSEEVSRKRSKSIQPSRSVPKSSDINHAVSRAVCRTAKERSRSCDPGSRQCEQNSHHKSESDTRGRKSDSFLTGNPEQLLQTYLHYMQIVSEQRAFSPPGYWSEDEHKDWIALCERKYNELQVIKRQVLKCIDQYQAEYDERASLLDYLKSNDLIDTEFEDGQIDKINALEQLLKAFRHHQRDV